MITILICNAHREPGMGRMLMHYKRHSSSSERRVVAIAAREEFTGL